MKSYKDLDIYTISQNLSVEIHELSLSLPNFELFEQGSQLRRSSKSITANIVEGYGRRRYKSDFIKYLTYAHASLLETISHLETIKTIYPNVIASSYIAKYEKLGGKLFSFRRYVELNWNITD